MDLNETQEGLDLYEAHQLLVCADRLCQFTDRKDKYHEEKHDVLLDARLSVPVHRTESYYVSVFAQFSRFLCSLCCYSLDACVNCNYFLA